MTLTNQTGKMGALVAENIDDYPESNAFGDPHVGSCEYFTVDQLVIDGIKNREVHGYVDESSFLHILVTKGSGVITNRDTVLSFKDGDSLFLPADSGDYVIRGTADILFTYEI